MKNLIHAIRRWSGQDRDETPFCSSADKVKYLFNRTTYHNEVTCPSCILRIRPILKQENDESSHRFGTYHRRQND